MLKAFVEKIVSLAEPSVFDVGNDVYSDKPLKRVEPYVVRPEGEIRFNSLDGIIAAVKAEIGRVEAPVFIIVDAPNLVRAFTTYRQDDMSRDYLYTAKAELPEYRTWISYDEAVIALRSKYVEGSDESYILNLISSITDENSITSSDNGISQSVNVRQGISLVAKETVKPRVKLRPYRTFLEVEQPESEFILRLKEGGNIGIIEADGGMWRLMAKKNVAEYLSCCLEELIKEGKVIVTE